MARLRLKEVAQQKGFSRGKLSRAADVDTNSLKRVYDELSANDSRNPYVHNLGVELGIF
jgi:hypothetical protein